MSKGAKEKAKGQAATKEAGRAILMADAAFTCGGLLAQPGRQAGIILVSPILAGTRYELAECAEMNIIEFIQAYPGRVWNII